MAFIIGGHPRSGTTMLFRLLRDHPEIGITGEFRCFSRLGARFPTYYGGLAKNWQLRGFLGRMDWLSPWSIRVQSGIFLWRYCLALALRVGVRPVGAKDVEEVMRGLFHRPVVGDKYPRYVFDLDKLSGLPDLRRVMIYRDGRDVVSSFLRKVRTSWTHLQRAQREDTPSKIAKQWVESMEAIERHRDALLVIRYEDFVHDPAPILASLATYLGVDTAGFHAEKIHDRSIGKFLTGLTSDEIRDVLAVAGGTLTRLGYL